ncbi:hypothetical protein Bequi_06415 [Brachybacterium sp. JHP9]|uniref:DUF3592 domain-containing protein n=1 Tax=Brachybacterium equifaecis TaxID=2910770 RepID=A0ABT0QZT5_9MICO|nr:hypothetical protein [Brachybacterium equifaecis]MCL6423024.1 hypothetical protein [Brachybacterium equifaecis]
MRSQRSVRAIVSLLCAACFAMIALGALGEWREDRDSTPQAMQVVVTEVESVSQFGRNRPDIIRVHFRDDAGQAGWIDGEGDAAPGDRITVYAMGSGAYQYAPGRDRSAPWMAIVLGAGVIAMLVYGWWYTFRAPIEESAEHESDAPEARKRGAQ